ncbi:MAG: hypothetical protein ABEH38_04585 [Flavobacteriales bacterium]
MRRSLHILFTLASIVSLFACKKGDDAQKEVKYGYFPVEPGHSVTYEVDSMFHDSAIQVHDTAHYFIKEKITRTFIDNEGRKSYRIERYRKDSMNGDWRIVDVWVANRNAKRAEKVEENRRYTKLVFPVRKGRRWDGNAFNDLDEQEYRYSEVHQSRSIGGEDLDSTVKVLQKDVKNLIEEEYAMEVYALGIGMVKKEERDLDTYTNGEIRKGSELYMRMIEHRSP